MSEKLNIEQLERDAMASTALEDFGPGPWREALARLVDSAESEARLTPVGRGILAMQINSRLVNRLEVQDYLLRHPQVKNEPIESPLILATLPRTGQTAAGWILDRDPGNRSLLRWFAKRPCPPPESPNGGDDPRILHERDMVAAMPRELLDMHLSDAQEPDECHWLLSNSFRGPHEIYSMHVPAYYEWVRDDAGIVEAYQSYALQLKLLQSRMPRGRWVLKNSPHLLYLDALHAVVPDAIFVQFHRDPLKVLASNCRLSLLLRNMSSDHVDPHEVGQSMLQLLSDYVERLLRFRASGVSRPWIDVHFAEFVNDPQGQIESIYDKASIEFCSAAREGMSQWVKENPRKDLQHARPADLSPYGLEPSKVRARFADYAQVFGVEFDGI